MKFRENDIVRLSNEYFDKIKSNFYFRQNLFFFDRYLEDSDSVLLREVNEQIPVAEICPVKMDGKEDRDIYYDPFVAAGVVRSNEPVPCYHVDTDEYYLQQFKEWFEENERSYYDIVKDYHFTFVHDLQHELPEIGQDLKINHKMW